MRYIEKDDLNNYGSKLRANGKLTLADGAGAKAETDVARARVAAAVNFMVKTGKECMSKQQAATREKRTSHERNSKLGEAEDTHPGPIQPSKM